MHERLKDEVHNAYMEWLKYAEPFCTDICLKQRVEFDFDWKCFVVEMDKYLQVQKIYGVKSLLSFDCIKWTDDEYEVEDAYESEDAHWVKIEHREVGCDDTLTIDLLQIDGKRVYTAENMGIQTAETLLSSKKKCHIVLIYPIYRHI